MIANIDGSNPRIFHENINRETNTPPHNQMHVVPTPAESENPFFEAPNPGSAGGSSHTSLVWDATGNGVFYATRFTDRGAQDESTWIIYKLNKIDTNGPPGDEITVRKFSNGGTIDNNGLLSSKGHSSGSHFISVEMTSSPRLMYNVDISQARHNGIWYTGDNSLAGETIAQTKKHAGIAMFNSSATFGWGDWTQFFGGSGYPPLLGRKAGLTSTSIKDWYDDAGAPNFQHGAEAFLSSGGSGGLGPGVRFSTSYFFVPNTNGQYMIGGGSLFKVWTTTPTDGTLSATIVASAIDITPAGGIAHAWKNSILSYDEKSIAYEAEGNIYVVDFPGLDAILAGQKCTNQRALTDNVWLGGYDLPGSTDSFGPKFSADSQKVFYKTNDLTATSSGVSSNWLLQYSYIYPEQVTYDPDMAHPPKYKYWVLRVPVSFPEYT